MPQGAARSVTEPEAAVSETAPPLPAGEQRRLLGLGWLPSAPILDLIDAKGGLRGCGVRRGRGGNREADRLAKIYQRARRKQVIHVYAADELCILVLHMHPSFVWGEQWWEAIAAPSSSNSRRPAAAAATAG